VHMYFNEVPVLCEATMMHPSLCLMPSLADFCMHHDLVVAIVLASV
jgi:hypothetical protein